MATRKTKAEAASAAPPKSDQLRAHDENGNVRPADDRYLTPEQIKARDAYVAEQTDDVQKAAQQIVEAVQPEPEELPND